MVGIASNAGLLVMIILNGQRAGNFEKQMLTGFAILLAVGLFSDLVSTACQILLFELLIVVSAIITFWVSIGTFIIGIGSILVYYGFKLLGIVMSFTFGRVSSWLFSLIS